MAIRNGLLALAKASAPIVGGAAGQEGLSRIIDDPKFTEFMDAPMNPLDLVLTPLVNELTDRGLLALAKRNDQVFGYQPPIETGKSIMDNWNPDTGQIEEPTLQGILGLLLGR